MFPLLLTVQERGVACPCILVICCSSVSLIALKGILAEPLVREKNVSTALNAIFEKKFPFVLRSFKVKLPFTMFVIEEPEVQGIKFLVAESPRGIIRGR